MIKKILMLLVLMVALSTADEFQIEEFGGVEEFPGEADQYIVSEFGSQLKKADPEQIQDNRFYLRQKYEDPFEDLVSYEIYEGKASGKIGMLNKFEAKGIPQTDLVKLKVFINKGAEADEDLEKVYFDGSYVYIEDEEKAFVNYNGKMVALTISQNKEVFVEMATQPAGAEVVVNGEVKGVTPLKFSVLGEGPTAITVRKEGYYPTTKVLTLSVGRTVNDAVLLIEKATLESPVVPLRNALLENKKNENREGLANLKEKIEHAINTWPEDSKEKISSVLDNFPPNPGQSSGESAEAFKKRSAEWEAARNEDQQLLTTKADLYQTELESLLKETDEVIAALPEPTPEPEVVAAPVKEEEPAVAEEPKQEEKAKEEVATNEENEDGEEYSEEEENESASYDEDERDEAVDDAVDAATDRFGSGDEYQKYAAWALFGVGVASGVFAYLEHDKGTIAETQLNSLEEEKSKHLDEIRNACTTVYTSVSDKDRCEEILINESRQQVAGKPSILSYLEPAIDTNKKTRDSHFGARNLFLGVSLGAFAGGGFLLYYKF